MISLLALLRQELRLASILRSFMTLLPGIVCFAVTSDPIYLKLCVLTIALWVGVHRVSQSAWLMLGHAGVLAVAITILYACVPYPYLFALVCAVGAFCRVYVVRGGPHLRSLGDFTLAPAVYLACELYATDEGGAASWQTYTRTIEHIPVSAASVFLFLFAWQGWRQWLETDHHDLAAFRAAAERALDHIGRRRQIATGEQPPDPLSYDPLTHAALHFFAVLLTGLWTDLAHMQQNQWAIMAATLVITPDLHKIRATLQDQVFGFGIGAIAGLSLMPFVTFSETVYGALVVMAALTVVAFNRVIFTYVVHGFFAVMIAQALGQGTRLGYLRVENLTAGALTGVAVALVVPHLFGAFKRVIARAL